MVGTGDTVALAGLGAVTGYGWGLGELWKGLMSGKSAARQVEFDDFVGLAAVVPEGGDEEDSITLFGRALYASGREAVADARQRGWMPGARVGLILCSSLGEVQGWRDLYFKHGGRMRRRHYLQLLPSTAPSMLMAELGFTGPWSPARKPAERSTCAYRLLRRSSKSAYVTTPPPPMITAGRPPHVAMWAPGWKALTAGPSGPPSLVTSPPPVVTSQPRASVGPFGPYRSCSSGTRRARGRAPDSPISGERQMPAPERLGADVTHRTLGERLTAR